MKKFFIKFTTAISSLFLIIFSFQNCAQGGFGVNGASTLPSGTTLSQGIAVNNSANNNLNSAAKPPFAFVDSSLGNGSVVTLLSEKVTGAGPGLRGCTGLMSYYALNCLHDSDFVSITSASAWGPNSYNAATDTYSVSMNVTARGFPYKSYFTRYILADGTRKEVTFTPTLASGSLTWVYTNPTFCVGPTPAPADIGSACSVSGQTATNACGTATCQ